MLLPSIVLIPLLAAAALAAVPASSRAVLRLGALLATGLVAVLGLVVFFGYTGGGGGYRFVTTIPWLGAESLGIRCVLGVDGMSAALVMMGGLVAFAAAGVSRDIRSREKEYYILLLLMTGGILGAFASLDLFFFYFFHEFALVPTFLMIGIWGRGEDRSYASFKVTLYLTLGALVALFGLVALYLRLGATSFDMRELAAASVRNPIPGADQQWIFGLLLFGFGILVSLWPFHSWAPMGYAAAPSGAAMLHAGVLKKFGLYGLIRVALPLLPEGAKSWTGVLVVLALGNILHCGYVAARTKDLNLIIGNSSVAHVGFAFLGIASGTVLGLTGAVVVMVAHGFLAALSYASSGYLVGQTRTLDTLQLGGVLGRMPFLGSMLMLALFAGCGLPGFANFVGESMVLFGAWHAYPAAVVAACWGALIVAAVYMLRAVRAVLHGPAPTGLPEARDLSHPWARLPFVLLVGALLLFGFVPRLLTDRIEPSVRLSVPGLGSRADSRPATPQPTWAQTPADRSGLVSH